MTRANRRGWYGERKRHALAARGIKTKSRTPVREVGIKDVEYSPDILGYYIYHPKSGEMLTYVTVESLVNKPYYKENIELALPPSQYKWIPVREELK